MGMGAEDGKHSGEGERDCKHQTYIRIISKNIAVRKNCDIFSFFVLLFHFFVTIHYESTHSALNKKERKI